MDNINEELYKDVYDSVLQFILIEGMYAVDFEKDGVLDTISKALLDLSKNIKYIANE
jgi:hypothetical protein